jgi:hypothetical protein
MSGVIKRKLRETWREAVAARLASAGPETLADGLAAFDDAVARGGGEAEAAHATLSSHGLLWHVEGAGFTTAGRPVAEAEGRHSVPTV